jgi:hypothetical protein
VVSWADNRAGVPGLGKVHPRWKCAFCGNGRGELLVVVVKSTNARGLRCADNVACIRRSNERKQLRLFADRAGGQVGRRFEDPA